MLLPCPSLKMKALLIISIILAAVCTINATRIEMRNIQVLTFSKGQYTAARRTSIIPQLICSGGTASGYSNVVDTVQCTNSGFDGVSVNWKCTSDLPNKYKLGKIHVSCEGYDRAGDGYVLAGSCSLSYELNINPDYHEPSKNNNNHNQQSNNNNNNNNPQTKIQHHNHTSLDPGATLALVLFATFLAIWFLCALSQSNSQQGHVRQLRSLSVPASSSSSPSPTSSSLPSSVPSSLPSSMPSSLPSSVRPSIHVDPEQVYGPHPQSSYETPAPVYVTPPAPVYVVPPTPIYIAPPTVYVTQPPVYMNPSPVPVASNTHTHTTVTHTTIHQDAPNVPNSSINHEPDNSSGSTHTSTAYGGSSSR